MAQNERGESPRPRGSRSRRLGEGQGRHRGTRCGTTRDEQARDREVLQPQRGGLYKSGGYARNVLGLTLGDLSAVPTEGGGSRSDRPAEVSRGHRRSEAGEAREARQCRKGGVTERPHRIEPKARTVPRKGSDGEEVSLRVESRWFATHAEVAAWAKQHLA